MFKKFFLFSLAIIFISNAMHNNEDTNKQIVLETAQKLCPIYQKAKIDTNFSLVYQDFLNSCMNEDFRINGRSLKTLELYHLVDKKNQIISNRDVISRNIEELIKTMEKIQGGYLPKAHSDCYYYALDLVQIVHNSWSEFFN